MADVLMPSSENDMNAGNAQPAPTNELLNGACDDDDNELTEEQKKLSRRGSRRFRRASSFRGEDAEARSTS